MSINNIDYEDIYDNINDYEYPYNHINREGVWDMNKVLVISILMAYQVVNDSSLTIVTDKNVFNDCYVLNLAIDHVCIDSNKGQISIELDDIIGIQFTDKRAIVGMKWYSNVATWNDVDKSVAESTPPTTLLSYLHLYTSSYKYYYLCFNS